MNFTFDKKDEEAIVNWLAEIDSEITFWSHWFETKGLDWPDDYAQRVEGKINFAYPDIIAGREKVKVLDVGSGPISRLGNISGGTIIELSACDPLAFVYKEMLDKAGVTPYVFSEFAMTERLRDAYPENTFDIVNMTNALDHSVNPLLGVFNMLAVCKKGGSVILYHRENEAEFEGYAGLHKWNIGEESGSLIFWNKSQRMNVTEILGEEADVKVSRIGDGTNKQETYIMANITKKGDCAFSTPGLNVYDKILTKIAFYSLSSKYREIASSDTLLEKLQSRGQSRPPAGFIQKLKYVVRKH